MAITQVGSDVTANIAADANQDVNLPSGLQENDIVIVAVCSDANLSTVGIQTSGYTVMFKPSTANPGHEFSYKRMGATPDTVVNITAGADNTMVAIQAWRGVDTTTALDNGDSSTASAGSGMPNPPAYTTVTADALRIVVGFMDDDLPTSIAAPSPYTNLVTIGENTVATVMMASYVDSSPDSENPAAFTGGTPNTDAWFSYHIALKPASAPSGAISGSTSPAFTTSGTLVGAGALSSAISPAFSTSGSLIGQAPISGSLSVAFSTSAVGTATAAASASINVAFSTSGTLLGAGVLAGSSSPAFTTSGTLLGAGVLQGSISPAFLVSGILLGLAPVSGSLSVTFSTSGTAVATASASASISVSFSTQGVLVGSGALVSSINPVFSTSGLLVGTGALSASINPAFSTSGTLLGAGVLSTTINVAFTTSGNLIDSSGGSTEEISGTANITFSTSGTLVGIGSLSTSTTINFSTSGNLNASGRLFGAIVPTFVLSGTMRFHQSPFEITPDPTEFVLFETTSVGAPSIFGTTTGPSAELLYGTTNTGAPSIYESTSGTNPDGPFEET